MNTSRILFLFIALFIFTACNQKSKSVKPAGKKVQTERVKAPDFNADTAFNYIKKQVDFGPRVPGTVAHAECVDYFVSFFTNLGLHTQVQHFKARTFDNKVFDGKNIIASINPQVQRRVLLCAHWDSRPFADHDEDKSKHYTPIDGANDGGSGVGVLMEIARQMSIQKPNIGIDIVLFDLEDYGQHAGEERNVSSSETWCLGSQYWAKNPHVVGYNARYGILLDMVGAEGAVFGKESFSRHYAPGVLDKVWNTAARIGYGNYFKNKTAGDVLDDHLFINRYAYIPTIDIIHYDADTGSSFFPHWHTIEDKLDKIDPASLKAVGQTVMEVIYNEK